MRTHRGFTLIELLLYVSITGVVILAMSVFLSVVQHQGVRSSVIMEVEDQSLAPMQIMTQIIRNATAITSPAIGGSSATATLTVPTASLSPTIFTLTSGAITMQEGTGSAVALTSGRVIVSNLIFTNLTTVTSPGTVWIQYTVSYDNPGTLPEYTYSKTTTGSATLR